MQLSKTRGRTTSRCPHCKVIYHHDFNNGDYIHSCDIPQADSALRKEDIVVVGNWDDYSGTGSVYKGAVMLQGVENELDIDAKINGVDFIQVTARGKHVATHRQRPREQYIDKS